MTAVSAVPLAYTKHMKRTNLVLDGDILDEARQTLGAKTYSETVNKALTELVRRHRARSIVEFFGKGLWKGDLAEMREDRPRRAATRRLRP